MSDANEIGTLPKGRRNDGLTRLGGALRRKGMTLSQIEARLLASNDRRCMPPLSDKEVLAIAASVARYPVGGPDPLEQAFEATSGEYPSKYLQFLALCNNLQNTRLELPIALPLKRIAGLLDCNWTRIQQFRNRAVKEGVLQPAEDYVPHRRAATYHFVPNSSTTPRTSSSPWFSTSFSSKSPTARSAVAASRQDEQRILRLANRGFRLFPCRPESKVPLLKGWPQKATCDSEQLRDWFRKHRGCNWACATGQASGVWVLDVDGPDAFAAMFYRFKEHNYSPETLCTVSGRGENGYHLYFGYPKDGRIRVGNRAGIKGWHDDLDVRGEDGYVMVPPSVWTDDKAASECRKAMPSRLYRFLQRDDHPIAESPDWLLELVGQDCRTFSDLSIPESRFNRTD